MGGSGLLSMDDKDDQMVIFSCSKLYAQGVRGSKSICRVLIHKVESAVNIRRLSFAVSKDGHTPEY